MLTLPIEALNGTVEKTHLWLKELADKGPFWGEEQAYTALRAVLHALRDRLTVEQAAHLGAQLPLLVRGIFYEGWRPARTPVRVRTEGDFLANVADELGNNTEVDPAVAVRAVFKLLTLRIGRGEIGKVIGALPAPLKALWPSGAGAERW